MTSRCLSLPRYIGSEQMSKATKHGNKVRIGHRRAARLAGGYDYTYKDCERKIPSRPERTTESG